MLPALINKCRYGPSPEIIEASSNQRKSLARQVFDRRGKTQFPIEPGLDGGLVLPSAC
jgi:hypothetical protein